MSARYHRRHMSREERQDRAMLGGKVRMPRTLKQFDLSPRMQKMCGILLWLTIGLMIGWTAWKEFQQDDWFLVYMLGLCLLCSLGKRIWKYWRAKSLRSGPAGTSPA